MVSSSPTTGTGTATRRSSHKTRVVAVDVGMASVRVVELEVAGDSARLLKRGAAPLPRGVWDDPGAGREHFAGAIRQAMSAAGIAATQVIACLPRRLVTVKYANLPYAPPEQVRGMVEYEAQQYIPFPMDEVVVDHQIVSETGDDLTTVMIVAARRKLVEELLAAFDKAGLEVLKLSVSSLGLAEHARDSTLPQALLEVEPGEIDMAVVAAGRLLFTRAASLVEPADTPGGAQLLAGEVVRSLGAYQNENRGQPVSTVLVASSNGQLPIIQEALGGVIDAPIARMNGQLLPAGDPDAAAYATATGLALQSDTAGMSRISLIPASRTERKVRARRRIHMLVAAAVALLAIAFAGVQVAKWLDRQAAERLQASIWNGKLDMAVTKLKDVTAEHDKISKESAVVSLGLARPVATVDVLKAVSDSVPKKGGVYLSQLGYDRTDKLVIHGNAPDGNAATDFALALQGAGAFPLVQLNYLGDAQTQLAAAQAGAPAPKQQTMFTITCNIKGTDALKPKLPGRLGAAQTASSSTSSVLEGAQ